MPMIFNLLVLLWFVNPVHTWESHVANFKIQILGTHASPTKFESQSEVGKYIFKLPTSYCDAPPWLKTTSLYTCLNCEGT